MKMIMVQEVMTVADKVESAKAQSGEVNYDLVEKIRSSINGGEVTLTKGQSFRLKEALIKLAKEDESVRQLLVSL